MARVTCEPRPHCEVEIIGSGRLSPGEAALLIAEIAKAAKRAQRPTAAGSWYSSRSGDRLRRNNGCRPTP